MLLHLTALCFFWFLCSLEANGGFHQDFKFWVLVDWLCPHNCSEDCDFEGKAIEAVNGDSQNRPSQAPSALSAKFCLLHFPGSFWLWFKSIHALTPPQGVSRALLGAAAVPGLKLISSVLREMQVTHSAVFWGSLMCHVLPMVLSLPALSLLCATRNPPGPICAHPGGCFWCMFFSMPLAFSLGFSKSFP